MLFLFLFQSPGLGYISSPPVLLSLGRSFPGDLHPPDSAHAAIEALFSEAAPRAKDGGRIAVRGGEGEEAGGQDGGELAANSGVSVQEGEIGDEEVVELGGEGGDGGIGGRSRRASGW